MSPRVNSHSTIGSESPLGSLLKKFRLWYYQYEVTFSLYVLTPTEKFVMNTIVLSFFALSLYGIISFTPAFISHFISRAISSLFWVYVNDSGSQLVVQQDKSVPWVNATKLGWEKLGSYNI
ncbi:hypothetical protein IFR05_008706 [Cadophora sp. M221]|nr:hypothetical protein IFR05_008706 [Cadophora sp. M221]